MKFIADLHIHSHFSRATSGDLDPEHLSLWAQKKGITIIGTGDFTHPGWIAELQEKLVEAGNGVYQLKPELGRIVDKDVPALCKNTPKFLLSGEISCIYKKGDKTRKLHHLILMPDFEAAIRLNKALDRIGNIKSDGRPILGLDSKLLLEMVLEASDKAFFIPAHIWTPWFSLFGSKSGFDDIEECFEDLTPHIHALETGLSSDPPMNRLLSSLDRYLLVSNSDAHSPSKLGREANIFNTELDYNRMIDAMVSKRGFEGTIEFYPEEGKYHIDGHRKCGVALSPNATRAYNGICPKCGKAITVGVLSRVEELSDRDKPEISKPFYSLIPLTEILSEIYDCGPATKKVISVYDELLLTLGPELAILMDAPLEDIRDKGGPLLATAIERMREGKVIRHEGYDGEYGVIKLFQEAEKAELAGQRSLFGIAKKENVLKKTSKPTRPDKTERNNKVKAQGAPLFDNPILAPLNDEQREAAQYNGGNLLITAGPGTGKTMTLSHRIAHIIGSGQAEPDQVLALTFTNKAAREMKERIEALLPRLSPGAVKTATFHGFCLEVLKENGGQIGIPEDFILCSEEDSEALAYKAAVESGNGKRMADKLLGRLPQMKKASVMGEEFRESDQDIIPLFNKYTEELRKLGMLDLDDLEVEALRLFTGHPETALRYSVRYPHIFVDEYQDTAPVQAALLKIFVREGVNNICAIGDPDQSIYGFRGADVENFYRFTETFPGSKEISLSKNYRSTQAILDAASQLMARNPLEGARGQGDLIGLAKCISPAEEAEMVVEQVEKLLGGITYFSLDSGRVSSHEDGAGIGFGDIAVLYRLNSQGDAFEEAFRRAGIPYARSGEKPLAGCYPANIIWRYLRTLNYPNNKLYRDAYLNLAGGVGVKGADIPGISVHGNDVEALIDQALTLHDVDMSIKESADLVIRMKDVAQRMNGGIGAFIDAMSLDRGIDHAGLIGDRTALMSLHAAKGLEWPVVFITGCEDKLMPCGLFGDRDDEEEKRLMYVGMTRARKRLIISHSAKRTINGRTLETGPSPFLALIPGDLCSPLDRTKWKRKRKKQEQLVLFPVL
jgi:DNA helicase II / ATP-dependent DNA helicase PcrA